MEEREESKGIGSALFAFLAGAAAGAGLALLLAPKSGEEVRGQLRDMASDAMDKTKEYARGMQEKAKGMMEKGKQKLEEQAPGIASAMEGAKEKMEERTNLS